MMKLSIRIDLDGDHRIGPGKIKLLEAVHATGSISAAARQLNMSYRRAWQLIDQVNSILGTPAVVSKTGGRSGGGALLTETGNALVRHYNEMTMTIESVAINHLAAINNIVVKPQRR